MASSNQPIEKKSPLWPVVLKVIALCVISFIALLLLLPAPPGGESGGGVTKVQRYTPPLRETVDPLASAPETRPVPPLQESVSPVIPAVPTVREEVAAERVVAPEPAPPMPSRKPSVPAAPAPVAEAPPPALTVAPEVPQIASREPAQPYPEQPASGEGGPLPSREELREWMRSQAWEFLGGVDAEGNILYRFEVWLQAPSSKLGGISSVTYEYIAPSATPKVREAVLAKGGFRARFGALACSNQVKITVKMNDGGTQQAVADGCRALN